MGWMVEEMGCVNSRPLVLTTKPKARIIVGGQSRGLGGDGFAMIIVPQVVG